MVQIQKNIMTPEQFAYWLQGMLEGNPNLLEEGLTPQQTKIIQDHLSLVFNKVTPDYTITTSNEENPFNFNPGTTILC